MNELKFALKTSNSIYEWIMGENGHKVTKTFTLGPIPAAVPQDQQVTHECSSIEFSRRHQLVCHLLNGKTLATGEVQTIVPLP